LGISLADNGTDLTKKDSGIFITEGYQISDDQVIATPRIGISLAQENLWRFLLTKSAQEHFIERIKSVVNK
jgi:3-methyladenine DNA glycosylase Mpg